MYKQNTLLLELLGPVITAMGYELLGVEQLPVGRNSIVRIYIDNESGITLDDCERVSRQVVGVLDVEDPIHGSYHLEVSSPGLDRPLFTLEQFGQYIGQQVAVKLRSKQDDRKKITGRIEAVDENGVVILEQDKRYHVPGGNIARANIVPEV